MKFTRTSLTIGDMIGPSVSPFFNPTAADVMNGVLAAFRSLLKDPLLLQIHLLVVDEIKPMANDMIEKYVLSKDYHCPPNDPPVDELTPFEAETEVIEHLPNGTSLVKWPNILNQFEGVILDNLHGNNSWLQQIDTVINEAVGNDGILTIPLNKALLSFVSL